MIDFKVKRFDPKKGSYFQDYTVDISPKDTVLVGLLKIRSEQDSTLGIRCSCRSAICGSCSMKMNHVSGLACNTIIQNVLHEGKVFVEPAGNMSVLKDLIVDFDSFWNKVHHTKPWLETVGKKPKRENLCSQEDMYQLSMITECIMCGSCVSDCTVLEIDDNFLGPAALAKISRFVFDPRDGLNDSRLAQASEEGGIWDCTHCFKCVEACPKKVAPMDRILDLRKLAMENGYTNNAGSRHSDAIVDSVAHSGTLNETTVLPKSYGFWNIKELLSLIPGGIRMIGRGKMPFIHKSLPSIKNIKKIFKKFTSSNN